MARRNSSLGFFGMFGRSGDLRQLDQALRAVDLHPALVPEGVKLTIVNLMKDHWPDEPPADSYLPLAGLLAYCVAGPEAFKRANGEERVRDVEARIGAALEARDDSLDSQLVLLAIHSRLINPEVVDRFDLSAESG